MSTDVGALSAEHGRSLLGYLLRRVEDPEDAADLLNETFLVAWRRRDDVPSPPEDRLWLYGVARHVLANHAAVTDVAMRPPGPWRGWWSTSRSLARSCRSTSAGCCVGSTPWTGRS